MRVESLGHGIVTDDLLTARRARRRIPADGTAPRRRHRPGALSRARPAARSIPSASRPCAREGFVESGRDGCLRVTPAGFPVLDAVVADLGRLTRRASHPSLLATLLR